MQTQKINELLRPFMSSIKVPQPGTKVYKDECMYSFDTPFSETGLYICLQTFYGIGKSHLERHHRKTQSKIYLHMKFEKVIIQQDENVEPKEKKVTRLGIGVEGGFDSDSLAKKYETIQNYSIFIYPDILYPWPDNTLPEIVKDAINGVINSDSALKLAEAESAVWDGEVLQNSIYAENLLQLDTVKPVPATNWKCDKCDLTTNLWLNLTDGKILCGRKFFDGSGGNNHAVDHYKEKQYPLAVKLGTITKDGKADVYSYPEDDMVYDPYLIKHLAHFGINISNMEKTDKSMVELELDLNQKFGEWATLTESRSNLQPLYGPGYTGLKNLGNSCYLNSVMQVLFSIPSFAKIYFSNADKFFDLPVDNPAEHLNIQLAKLGVGLLSGNYSKPPKNEVDESFCIAPNTFKNLVGKGHQDFSTKKQQDVQEYLLHLLTKIQRFNNRSEDIDPSDYFLMKVEERYQCNTSKKVKYIYRNDYCMPLTIPLEATLNKEEVAEYNRKKNELQATGNANQSNEKLELVRPILDFSSCLQAFTGDETIVDFYSSAIEAKTTATKTSKIAKFPQYLLVHLKKYMVLDDWSVMKIDTIVNMPDILNLYELRASGMKQDEELLPELDVPQQPKTEINEEFLNMMLDMGLPREHCRRALHETKNAGIAEAFTWIEEHHEDPLLNQPVDKPTSAGGDVAGFVADTEALNNLICFGVTERHAKRALRETGNNMERAADWAFSHEEEPEDVEMTDGTTTQSSNDNQQFEADDPNNFQYRLKAFISHMGTSTAVGHYVCHILKDEKWVIFNDEKVALSENPPKGMGYIYLYERVCV